MNNETTPSGETAVERLATSLATIGMIGKLACALAKAQGAFETPTKSKEAKVEKEGRLLYKYKYSDLDDLIKATRPALTANGLAVIQNVHSKPGAVGVSTLIAHESGQLWSSDILWIPVGGKSQEPKPQDYGIAETYARRYSMSAALNVAAEDDLDANMREHEKNENAPRKVRLPDEKPQSAPKTQPDAKLVVDASTTKAGSVYKGESGEVEYVNKQKVKRMFGIAQVHSVSVEAMKKYLGAMTPPITSSDHIPATLYDKIVEDIQNGKVK